MRQQQPRFEPWLAAIRLDEHDASGPASPTALFCISSCCCAASAWACWACWSDSALGKAAGVVGDAAAFALMV